MRTEKTSLYEEHQKAGARFAPFAGWEMPLHYTAGAIEEHQTTRSSAGLFDISHMTRFVVTGADAGEKLDRLLTARVSALSSGSSTYGLLCDEEGGIIDDLFVYRRDEKTEPSFLLVGNASRRAEDTAWLNRHLDSWEDHSDQTGMIALQGPRAEAILARFLPRTDISGIARFGCHREGDLIIARTGYTGEDGFEIILPRDQAPSLWKDLLKTAGAAGIRLLPAGLAARDSLRLEAGFPLYGQELTREITPVEARLLWACDLDHPFLGREAILRRREEGPARTLRRLILEDAGVPRPGCPILDRDGTPRGVVTSGGKAPSLGVFIANALVDREVSAQEPLVLEVRNRSLGARQHRGPFYRPSYQPQPAAADLLERSGEFSCRHVGPSRKDQQTMLNQLGVASMEELLNETIPAEIRLKRPLNLPRALTEDQVLARLQEIASRNHPLRSLVGQGYADTITPPVIQRNVLEDPGWYTQYTPYQAEISQGRLEALMSYQTMIVSLTAMDISNASLLDEATAAAEAMTMALRHHRGKEARKTLLVDPALHPQTIAHLRLRAAPLGVELQETPPEEWEPRETTFAGIIQYPDTLGIARDRTSLAERLHQAGALLIVATDLLALTLLAPPGAWGADIVLGNTQRFGVPLGFGGPHAAFLATREQLKRLMPGRLVGESLDQGGNPALRLALQTREQHIRRDKATSNICTAQVLPAILAAFYAIYHGPEGLGTIARRVCLLANALREALHRKGTPVLPGTIFDTVTLLVEGPARSALLASAEAAGFNLRELPRGIGITLDERSTPEEILRLLRALGVTLSEDSLETILGETSWRPHPWLERRTPYLEQAVFRQHRSETALLRYLTRLRSRDLSLAQSMIPLGSCTMKLNPTAAMMPITWREFSSLHPYAPPGQAEGYRLLMKELSAWLCEITGFDGCTLQPNSGAHGEFTGLMIIRSWHLSRGDANRRVCLVPDSAHGTNPASAAMAGMEVVVVKSTPQGRIDLTDLEEKALLHRDNLAALMVTYPSTCGIFEEDIVTALEIVHRQGGQVYLDGANMNAQVGLTSPGAIGADVCHLNLHKTFAIPHGGGGPGVGPVLTAAHLTPFLPGTLDSPGPTGVVVAAPAGSASILPIPYAYIAMLGGEGLRAATEQAILSANYIASRLAPYLDLAYTGPGGRVAHECILDFRRLERETGVTVADVAKRLADYGFHAPTMSWPVQGTLMVEPTESESLEELDRFCDAMISITREIEAIARGEISLDESPLRNAPHTAADIAVPWDRPYTREEAVYPAPWCRENKFWPPVGRVDNVQGDRHLICSCQ
ncbi:glycine dehydrogenase (decarboxylating) alpha subunit /glycine dehydrogenase (decarboxylating) beta subunit [Alkalispirochaeta americana]|uniref:Glycine cleavage system T protein n=1 Tax=Alkalispirochaeta americana TaxID=159291 RepID=A0A1N6PR40_9SPIO|nr:aminomethyl-transferring glycine dehydrogenase [Alkalispirochaeta americana]SIQ06669.1 glycine dehydrogenase (decarboxylating) alpha subunit /glycine dehydrogenase (decarboxylating) beta subunit [Alkalispirochaeta americana]